MPQDTVSDMDIADFLEENYALFVTFCEQRGASDDDAQQAIDALRGEN
jgi:hypothetical protein